ncbi:hypothetical protein [Sporichthya polymorpha]|uniref:hypothetical protein n=1 Tax=Sporichthya polymorpha TaxID=35751 RepID=UPI0012EB65EF|nr:hypothetical protein [Sporichthya polymorpha]
MRVEVLSMRRATVRWSALGAAIAALSVGALAIGTYVSGQQACSERASEQIRALTEVAVTPLPAGLRSRASADSGCDSGGFPSVSWVPMGAPTESFGFYADAGWARMSAAALRGYGHADAVGFARDVLDHTVEVVFIPQADRGFFQAAFVD